MDYNWGESSKRKLNECDIRLRLVMNLVIKWSSCDMTVITGHRPTDEQYRKFIAGQSKIDGRTKLGKHNYFPSKAIDVAPYINGKALFDNNSIFYYTYIAGLIEAAANIIGVKIRWGGNFDRDGEIGEQSFDDWGHFEIDE